MSGWTIAALVVFFAPFLVGLILLRFPRTRRIGGKLLGHGTGRGGDWARRQQQAREDDAAIASHDFDPD